MKPLYLLGPAGSFSDQAGRRFEGTYRKQYVVSLKSLFEGVKRGGVGLAPVHNKIIGPIVAVWRFWRARHYRVLKRFRIRVSFVLAVRKKMALSQIGEVYCVTPVFGQCGIFLRRYLPDARIYLCGDSSSTLFKKIAQSRGKAANAKAAIGPEMAARIYGLVILRRQVEDDPKDWTEFVLFESKNRLETQKKT